VVLVGDFGADRGQRLGKSHNLNWLAPRVQPLQCWKVLALHDTPGSDQTNPHAF
jgi:hypothetical protein